MKDYNVAYGKTSTIICGGGGGSDNMSVSDSGTKNTKIADLQQQIEELKKYKQFFERCSCHFAEGVEFMTKSEIYDAIKREVKELEVV